MEMSTQNVMNTVHFGGAPLETRYHIEKGHIAGVQGRYHGTLDAAVFF